MFIPQEYLNSPVCFGVISMTTFSLNGRCLRILKSGKTTSSKQLEESLRIKFNFVVLFLGIDIASRQYPPSTIMSTETMNATSFFFFFHKEKPKHKDYTDNSRYSNNCFVHPALIEHWAFLCSCFRCTILDYLINSLYPASLTTPITLHMLNKCGIHMIS